MRENSNNQKDTKAISNMEVSNNNVPSDGNTSVQKVTCASPPKRGDNVKDWKSLEVEYEEGQITAGIDLLKRKLNWNTQLPGEQIPFVVGIVAITLMGLMEVANFYVAMTVCVLILWITHKLLHSALKENDKKDDNQETQRSVG